MKKFLCVVSLIVVCFTFSGCGNKEKNENNSETKVISTQEENNNYSNASISLDELSEMENYAPKAYDNVKEVADSVELYSDDTKFVFKTNENTTGIYYHNGNDIIGYEVRVDYETSELANAAKLAYNDYEEDDVESVSVNGKTLIVTFKKEAYQGTTLDEIKQAYSLLQVLKNK